MGLIDGKVALVTGAGTGIGRESAILLAREGAIVVLTGRRIGPLESVVAEIKQQGGPPIPIDYSMEKSGSDWKVYDVVIDGASLVTTYRGTFNDQVQRGGIDGLVKALQDRNRTGEPAKAAPKK